MDLTKMTITKAIDDLKTKKYSSVELTKAYLERIHKLDAKLNAFITVIDQEAIAQAEKADVEREKGSATPLLGIPIALKDLFVTKGVKTTAASKVLENYIGQY